jgi:hypothetical protein
VPTAKQGVKVITGIFVGIILAAFLMPIAIGAVSDPGDAVYNQSTTETVELKPGLNATVDSVTSGTSATYTIEYDGDSTTSSVNVGSNQTLTVGGIDVTVAPSEAGSSYAVTEYEYPKTAGWGAAGDLWLVIPLLLVLPIFMWAVSKATNQF